MALGVAIQIDNKGPEWPGREKAVAFAAAHRGLKPLISSQTWKKQADSCTLHGFCYIYSIMA